MNQTVTEVLLKACLQPVLLGDKFAMEHMMVVSLLHNNVGTDIGMDAACIISHYFLLFSMLIGAYFIQALAEKLNQLLEDPLKTDKQSNCAILLFSHLYNYRVSVCHHLWSLSFLSLGDSLSAHL